MSIKVSVVVPTYNTGDLIEPCIDSLLAQTLSKSEYELIFVDDGSTDDTPARLDKLAAEQPNVRVFRIPNSGWPGKPRNVGVDQAIGEFVQFVDHDDSLGPEALERLYEYAVANDADIVIGKVGGVGRFVLHDLFRKNTPRATVADAPLIYTLTPHKMFRRGFLNDIGLRFPEGRRRLEDQVYMAEAYVRARNTSILADYTCYYFKRRADAQNASSFKTDPVGYYRNLREAIDVVDRYVEPGALKDSLLRRWLEFELIGRARDIFPDRSQEYVDSFLAEMSQLAKEHFGSGVLAGLAPLNSAFASAIISADADQVLRLAGWHRQVHLEARLRDLRWDGDLLTIEYEAELRYGDAPMQYRQGGDFVAMKVPRDVFGGDPASDRGELPIDLNAVRVDLALRNRESWAQTYQPGEIRHEIIGEADAARVLFVGVARIDPLVTGSDESDGLGVWDAHIRMGAPGMNRQARLGANRPAEVKAPQAAIIGGPTRLYLPYWTETYGNLSVALTLDARRIRGRLKAVGVSSGAIDGSTVRIRLPLRVIDPASVRVRFVDLRSRRSVELTGSLDADGVLRVGLPDRAAGLHRASIEIALPGTDENSDFARLGVCLVMRRAGGAAVVAARPEGAALTPRRVARGIKRRAIRVTRRIGIKK